ncbi:MAG TPA: 3-hydroxylacyl-ACP dehydratase [Oleiagrimonas sp.]|nr:3-hydroxylacyl-ACP dehydratase [Oleiagrimonas sp.]
MTTQTHEQATAFPTPAQLLPHAGRAVWVDAIVDNTASGITALTTITSAHPCFVAGRGVPAWAGIEMMAQAFAMHASLSHADDKHGTPRRGMLLGTRRYRSQVAWFAEGATLTIHAARSFGHDGGMAACDCRIERDGTIVAESTIIILEESDP